jgi:hypothetical protein
MSSYVRYTLKESTYVIYSTVKYIIIANKLPAFAMPSLVFAEFQLFLTGLLHPCCAQGQALVLLSGVSVTEAAAAAAAAVSTHNTK